MFGIRHSFDETGNEAEARTCPHRNVVPIDKDWARCEDCGEDGFPISAEAAGIACDDPVAEAEHAVLTAAEVWRRRWPIVREMPADLAAETALIHAVDALLAARKELRP